MSAIVAPEGERRLPQKFLVFATPRRAQLSCPFCHLSTPHVPLDRVYRHHNLI